MNDQGERSAYSEQGANLWVCAPSSDSSRNRNGITTTDNHDFYLNDFGGTRSTTPIYINGRSGTSAAAPIVSGVAALVRSANTHLTWRDVKLILAASARQNDEDNPGWEDGALQYGSDTERYHFNHEYGFGVVDAKAAVDLAAGWTLVPTLGQEAAQTAEINLRIPDNGTEVTSQYHPGLGCRVHRVRRNQRRLQPRILPGLAGRVDLPGGHGVRLVCALSSKTPVK